MNKTSDCLIFVAFTLLFLFPQIGLAYENTFVFPVDEDDDYEYGTYQTHDNKTGERRLGLIVIHKEDSHLKKERRFYEEVGIVRNSSYPSVSGIMWRL